MTYNIYWNGKNFELWVDGFYVDEWRTWPDAKEAAEARGAQPAPKRSYNDEGAPF